MSLPRAQRSRLPALPGMLCSPKNLLLPLFLKPFPLSFLSSLIPGEGSLLASGFSQIFSQSLQLIDVVAPAKMVLWLGGPARRIQPVLPSSR